MNNKEFMKLKSSIAIKDVLKIIVYSLSVMFVLNLLVDFIFNDTIANSVYTNNPELYYFCIANKPWILSIGYIFAIFIVCFFVIQKSNGHIIEVIKALNQIVKEPEKNIELSGDLTLVESKLNNIRIDLITSQNAAKEAETKKNDLIMYMAHDLKTPLTSIIGYLTLLTQEKEISKPIQDKYMKIALSKALRVEDLINQFFEITRYNLQNMSIEKQKLDLVFLLEQLVEEVYPMLQERDLTCVMNGNETIPFQGDGDKLARAFSNLLKNAISYSYPHTPIEIKLEKTESQIQIVFRNKGDKIPKHKLEKLFEKFYRLDESRTSGTGGSGLGLAITKQIIELHNGKIYAKNEKDFIEFYIEFEIESA